MTDQNPTGVQEDELEILGYLPEGPLWNGERWIIRNLYRNTGSGLWPRAVTGLVEAQAKIVALEAEIARLRGYLSDIANSDDIENALDPHRNKRTASTALKGCAE